MMKAVFLIISLAMILSGCEGILDNIYDEAQADTLLGEGFQKEDADGSFVLQIDATSYDHWIYIDLHERTMERREIPRTLSGEWDGQSGIAYQQLEGNNFTPLAFEKTDAQDEPENWDFAIHHFDVKTNGGMVAREGESVFVADEWADNQVIVDMREMMAYRIGYQCGKVNRLLSSWVKMDITTPPPVYSASGDTYILKMKDGSQAALKLLSYMSERGTKGFLTISISLTPSSSPLEERGVK